MKHFSFVILEGNNISILNDFEQRFEKQETVSLDSDSELKTLLKCFSTCLGSEVVLSSEDIEYGYYLSKNPSSIPEDDFGDFYENWLESTGRENNMDEYGQLLVLNSFLDNCKSKQGMVVLSESI